MMRTTAPSLRLRFLQLLLLLLLLLLFPFLRLLRQFFLLLHFLKLLIILLVLLLLLLLRVYDDGPSEWQLNVNFVGNSVSFPGTYRSFMVELNIVFVNHIKSMFSFYRLTLALQNMVRVRVRPSLTLLENINYRKYIFYSQCLTSFRKLNLPTFHFTNWLWQILLFLPFATQCILILFKQTKHGHTLVHGPSQ